MGILDWFRTLRRPAGANRPAEQIPAGAFGPTALEITPTAPRRSFVDAGIQFDRSLFGDVFSACLAPSTVIQDACAGFVLDAPPVVRRLRDRHPVLRGELLPGAVPGQRVHA